MPGQTGAVSSAEATGTPVDREWTSGDSGTSGVLQEFREAFYECLGRRADALFELADAILAACGVHSPPHLSLTGVHRRGWGSLYAALSKGNLDDETLRALLFACCPLAESPAAQPAVYAVDVSVWPRCDAEASPERGYYYHPSPPLCRTAHSGGLGLPAHRWTFLRARFVGRSR